MKKVLLVGIALLIFTFGLTGCGSRANNSTSASDGKIKVVTTIFPLYDWVKQIAGDEAGRMEITLLMGKGIDLHSYQPTPEDIMKLSRADVFIYVGGESDAWVKDAVKEAANKNMIALNLLDIMGSGVKEEILPEGAEEEHEHKSEHEHDKPELDEHIWLSPRNAKILCRAVTEALAKADATHAATYRANGEAYQAKLDALDADYKNAVVGTAAKTLIFGDRFPFRYLTDDYGIRYYAAFAGCSAETDASFKTIAFLADKVNETNVPVILVIDGSDGKIAAAIRDNSAHKQLPILKLDSMQSTTLSDAEKGKTYLSVMGENLSVLKMAMGK